MSDGSIFGGIMGDISSFGDALSGLGSAVTGSKAPNVSNSENADYRSLLIEQRLNRNMNQQPYGPQAFRAGKTDPAPQVNSEVINQQWLQRLNRYSSIPQVEGAQARKAY